MIHGQKNERQRLQKHSYRKNQTLKAAYNRNPKSSKDERKKIANAIEVSAISVRNCCQRSQKKKKKKNNTRTEHKIVIMKNDSGLESKEIQNQYFAMM